MDETRLQNVYRGTRVTAEQILDDLERGDYEQAALHATQIRDTMGAMLPHITILLNAREITVDHNILTYEEIVELANVGKNLTVQYARGGGDRYSGTVIRGQSLTVKDGTEIDAVFTGYA
jgi:hypothetical protein